MTPTPNIADAGREINKTATSRAARINRERRVQRGITLVELLIGIAIGLLVVAIAMGALMVSYGVKGSVSDASNIQQQAAYAMRVIGGQLRQATSLYLNPNPSNAAGGLDPLTPVAFEKKADPTSGTFNSFDLGNPASLLSSTGTSNLTVGFRRYKDPVFVRDPSTHGLRQCRQRLLLLRGKQKLQVLRQALDSNNAQQYPILNAINLDGARLRVHWAD